MNRQTWRAAALAAAVVLAGAASRTSARQAADAAPEVKAAPAAQAKAAAVVNGEAIPMAEVDAVIKQGNPSPVPLPDEQRKAAKHQALAFLIDEALMRQFLEQHAPPVTGADVDKKLTEMDAELKKQGKSLAEFCRESGQTETRVREGIGFAMRWHAYARQNLTDAQVEQYYAENKDYFDGVMVKASHIVLRVPPNAPPADQEAARKKLSELRAQVVEGKLDFAEAAKKHSQCPSAPNGGDLDFFPRKWVVEEPFAKAAFSMKVGDVSDIVQTEYGLHLIKVTDRKAGKPSEFAKIKEDVREFCAEDMRQALLAKMRKEAKIEVNVP